MGYVDEEGIFHSSEPENQPSSKVASQKQNGCIGCGCAGCLGVIVVGFVIGLIIISVLVFSANRLVEYVAENEDIIESQFEEHEDEIMDIFNDIEDIMNDFGEAVGALEPTNP